MPMLRYKDLLRDWMRRLFSGMLLLDFSVNRVNCFRISLIRLGLDMVAGLLNLEWRAGHFPLGKPMLFARHEAP